MATGKHAEVIVLRDLLARFRVDARRVELSELDALDRIFPDFIDKAKHLALDHHESSTASGNFYQSVRFGQFIGRITLSGVSVNRIKNDPTWPLSSSGGTSPVRPELPAASRSLSWDTRHRRCPDLLCHAHDIDWIEPDICVDPHQVSGFGFEELMR